jgi:diguanylate cyclase (GGDEF)-like protein/PAS domain S-box-containing protein
MAGDGPVRILLMEDDAGLARLCRGRLRRDGYVVDHAQDGEQGLAMSDAGAYDIILLDHTMPVYDGLEVIRRLAARGRLTPVVMVTGTGSEQVAVEAVRLGARDYVVKDPNGGYLDLLPTVIERVLRQQRAEEYTRLAAKVFENVSEGILITDPQGRIVTVNEAFTGVTGYTAEEVLGSAPSLLSSGGHDAGFRQEMRQALTETGRWKGELWDRRKDGEAFPVWLTISAVRDSYDAVANYVAVFTDITFRKQTEERLRHMATHDPLTGLPNRDLSQDRMRQAMAIARRRPQLIAVALLDMDDFKLVNDTMGHAVGDLLLKEVAARLLRSVRGCDTVARLGGDEFILLLPELTSLDDVGAIADRVLDTLSQPYLLDGRQQAASASMGISLYPTDSESPDVLLRNADSAMYRAKQARTGYEFWSREHPVKPGPRKRGRSVRVR